MHDYVIKGGLIVDGLGHAPFRGDLAITDGKISGIGQDLGEGAQTLDAIGAYVTPGFVDIHRHGDGALFREGFGALELSQGLTTIINGNCGLSIAPCLHTHRQEIVHYLKPIVGEVTELEAVGTLEAYFACARRQETPINVGMLVGSGTVRAAIAGYEKQVLSPDEMRQASEEIRHSLEAGALGVSLGLGYAPECFYRAEDLIQVLRPLAGTSIPLVIHLRGEGDTVCESIEEMLTVGRALRCPIHISHLKCIGKSNWGLVIPKALALMEQARAEGLDVSHDVYPYTAGSTQLIHVLPPDFLVGGPKAIVERLRDRRVRDELTVRLREGRDFDNIVRLVGWENIIMSTLGRPENKVYEGKRVTEIAHLRGTDPYECVYDMLIEEGCVISMVDFIASEEDIITILRDDHAAIISDSIYPTEGIPHPRLYGTYARVLERFVKELGALSLEQAVWKMTAVPCDLFGIRSKGRLVEGADADLVVFHLDHVHEVATYGDPKRFSQGLDAVFVNGELSVRCGAVTGVKAGRIITR